MDKNINSKAIYKYREGEMIYFEGKPTTSIAIILKGQVSVYKQGVKMTLGKGDFIGLYDLYYGKYQFTYKALEPLIINVFPVSKEEDLKELIREKDDYRGYMVASLSNYIKELNYIYQELLKHKNNLFNFLKDNYRAYKDYAKRLGYKSNDSLYIQNLQLQEVELERIIDKVNYYTDYSKIPADIIKVFYSHVNEMALFQLNDQVKLINKQIEAIWNLADEVSDMIENLAGREKSFFNLIVNLAIEVEEADKSSSKLIDIMDSIVGQTNLINKFFQSKVGGFILNFDRKMMESAYNLILTGAKDKARSLGSNINYRDIEVDEVLNQLSDSYQKLLNYAEFSQQKSIRMKETMDDFVNLRDRMSSDKGARQIRKELSKNHYILYKKLFLKVYRQKEVPRIVDLFLKYGYADERLLSEERLINLYYLEEKQSSEIFAIYNIKDWLINIYEGKEEPSKNDFDQEYKDVLLEMKNKGKLTEDEVKDRVNSCQGKLEYEMENMFKTNNRLVNGQISTFVPILHEEMVFKNLNEILISGKEIEETIKGLLKIDSSVFDREVIYSNQEKGILREYIIKRVYPKIILMPIVGERSVMWQEICGKKRDNPGRFILPSFFDGNLEREMIKLLGRFRWEMCRRIEGVYWNDIQYKSLTSEYSDFLQFYRNNNELSEERKNRVKLQIQKGRKNSREIFILDYEQWILYESKGAIKLNKPVREILASYCPFSKDIREKLGVQPFFKEIMLRFEREKQKRIRGLENRKQQLKREGISFPRELDETLEYYINL